MAAMIVGGKHKKVLWFVLPAVVLFLLAVIFLLGKELVISGESIRLVEMRPARNVGLRANLTFAFSRPVVAQEEVGKTIDSHWCSSPRRSREIPLGHPAGTAFPSGGPFPAFHFLQRGD